MFKVSACEDTLVLVKIGKLLLYLVELWVVMGSIQWRALAILTEGNWLWDSVSLEEGNIVFLVQCAWLILVISSEWDLLN